MPSGPVTPRVCNRPGCARPASTRLVIDVRNLVVSVDLRVDEVGGAAVLCDQHAERIVPPRGWTIDDRRILAPRLFPVDRPAPTAGDPGEPGGRLKRVRRRLAPTADEQLALAADVSYALPEAYETTSVPDPDHAG